MKMLQYRVIQYCSIFWLVYSVNRRRYVFFLFECSAKRVNVLEAYGLCNCSDGQLCSCQQIFCMFDA